LNIFFFARHIGNKVLIMADGRNYAMPDFLLKNPRRLRDTLSAISSGFNIPGQKVLVSTGDLRGISFQSIFVNAIPLNVEEVEEARILRNLSAISNPVTFNSGNARIINGLPSPEDVRKIDPNQDPSLWVGVRDTFNSLIAQAGYTLLGDPPAMQIKSALSESPSVLILVAHSDGQKIYLPDGTPFDVSALTEQEKQNIFARQPLVILLSCNTATSDLGVSFAQRLLDVGPSMVIAPNGKLAVQDVQDILKSFFANPLKNMDAIQVFIEAVRTVYPDWIIPSDDGKEHFFEFRVQNNLLISEEKS